MILDTRDQPYNKSYDIVLLAAFSEHGSFLLFENILLNQKKLPRKNQEVLAKGRNFLVEP